MSNRKKNGTMGYMGINEDIEGGIYGYNSDFTKKFKSE
jgi:hypothetical protein